MRGSILAKKKGTYQLAFNQDLYNLQQEIMDTMDSREYKFHIAILGRQAGKSYLDKRIVLEYSNNRAMRGLWISPAISSSNVHWNDLLAMIEESGIPVKNINKTTKEIHFHGGGYVGIRSAIEPDNIRGDSLDYIILDEAAFFRNGRYVWESVCMPMISTSRGIMLMTTTPNGQNWVYKLYQRGLIPNKLVKSWHLSATKSPIQDKEFLKELRKTVLERTWRTEYLAEFLADGGGVFSGTDKASTAEWRPTPRPGHTYVMGIDVGGETNDPSVVTVLDKYTREQVFGEIIDTIGTKEMVRRILELINEWNPEKTFIEKNGVGVLGKLMQELLSGQAMDELDEQILGGAVELDFDNQHKLTLVHMDNPLKCSSVERLAVDIEYGRFKILNGDCEYGAYQMSEMSTFEAKRTASGLQVTYRATEGNHDDSVSALYLAYMGIPRPARDKKKGKKNPFKNSSSPFRGGSSAPRTHRRGNRR